MDPLFKNSYVRDRQMAKELYGFLCFKRWIIVFTSIYLAILIVWSLFDRDFKFLAIFVLLSIAFYTLKAIIYHQNVKTVLKRDLEIFKKEPTIILTVTSDSITHCIKDDAEYTLEFSSIKNAIQTKNYIFLHTKSNLVYGFKKDGFTLGTKDNFIAFLKSQTIKVRGK